MLVEKLGDNKIIVRQLAVEGLKGITKDLKPFALIPQLTAFLSSPKWHIREEILEFIITTFIEFSDSIVYFTDYDGIVKAIAKLLHDDKPKVIQIAYETFATVANVGDKNKVYFVLKKENVEEPTLKKVIERIEAKCIPKLNSEGNLEFPYIANELTTQNSFYSGGMINPSNNAGQINVFSYKNI